jgi:release factor glutamine methyltransferase
MLTVLEIIKRSTEFLAKHGVESARLNAELLIGHALALKRMQLYLQFERPLTEHELAVIRPLVKRRSEREPLQYIIGHTEFCGLKLKVDRRALIPRPETELLVELIKESCASQPPSRVLDLGTGSGAIILALGHAYPSAELVAIDASADALALAQENAATLGLSERVRWAKSDWFSAVDAGEPPFGLIVSNPPYLSDEEVAATEPEVRKHEPHAALGSGPSGLEAIATIVREARARLVPGGRLALETGPSQHAAILELVRAAGYATGESRKDLTGRDRFILATA